MIKMVEVLTKAQRKRFVLFQSELYKGVPQFVPNLLSDELANLDPAVNPAFDYCDMRFWLAYRGDKVVGRVGGIVNHAANKKFDRKFIRVTRIDFLDEVEIVDALIEVVAQWGREQGLTHMIGPIGFSDMDKQGMLVKGYDRRSMFVTYYNYPYYVTQFERVGFEKEVDWVETLVYTDHIPEKMEKIQRICDRVVEKLGVDVKYLTRKKDVAPYVEKILGLVNREFSALYGVVELPPRTMKYYAKQFVPLINLKYLPLIEKDGELIAFGLLAPSLAEAMQKTKGRLFPFGWITVLRAIAKPKVLEMYSVAVRSEYKNTGLPAVLLNEMTQMARKNGVLMAETGPELELNYNVQGLWEGYRSEKHFKRRRCWIKSIQTPQGLSAIEDRNVDN